MINNAVMFGSFQTECATSLNVCFKSCHDFLYFSVSQYIINRCLPEASVNLDADVRDKVMSHKSFRVLSAVQNFAKFQVKRCFKQTFPPFYWQYQHKQTQFLVSQNMECLKALPNSAWKALAILSKVYRTNVQEYLFIVAE